MTRYKQRYKTSCEIESRDKKVNEWLGITILLEIVPAHTEALGQGETETEIMHQSYFRKQKENIWKL